MRTAKKEIFLLFIVSAMLLFCSLFTTVYAQDADISGTISRNTENIVGAIRFVNDTNTPQDFDIILASYYGQTLDKVSYKSCSVPANTSDQLETVEIPVTTTAEYVKLMVWSDTAGCMPFCKETSLSSEVLNAELSWAPPKLVNPQIINLGPKDYAPKLNNDTDYIINLSNEPREIVLRIEGGRNVAVFGGHVKTPPKNEQNSSRRAIYILDGADGRTVHIEGVLVSGHDDSEGDAIAIKAPNTIVQVQNFRVENLQGAIDSSIGHTHADIIQPWGGVKELRVDRLTGSSNYQGLFLKTDYDPNGDMYIRNVNLTANDEWFDGAKGGFVLWLDTKSDNHTYLENVYVKPRGGTDLSNAIWPTVTDSNDNLRPNIKNGYAYWPNLSSRVTGGVNLATDSTPVYVPSGAAGIGYVHKWGNIY